MKAMVNGIKSNGESFKYALDDVAKVIYTNGNIEIIFNDGKKYDYSEAISKGYKYEITIIAE